MDEATGERAAGDSLALERGLVPAHRCSLERPEVPGKNGAAAEEMGVDDAVECGRPWWRPPTPEWRPTRGRVAGGGGEGAFHSCSSSPRRVGAAHRAPTPPVSASLDALSDSQTHPASQPSLEPRFCLFFALLHSWIGCHLESLIVVHLLIKMIK